jgi:hypothetical protein
MSCEGAITWRCHRLKDTYEEDKLKTLSNTLQQERSDLFPCLIAMCGSMHGYQLVSYNSIRLKFAIQ